MHARWPFVAALLVTAAGAGTYAYGLPYVAAHRSPMAVVLASGAAEARWLRDADGRPVRVAVESLPPHHCNYPGLAVRVAATTDSMPLLRRDAEAFVRQLEPEADRRQLRWLVVWAEVPRAGPAWLAPPRVAAHDWNRSQRTGTWRLLAYSRP